MRRLFLGSNSMDPELGFLGHVGGALQAFMGGEKVLFIPYASKEAGWDASATRVKERLAELNIRCRSIHEFPNAQDAVGSADAIFVGGGNTYRLLRQLQRLDLLPLIRAAVDNDVPYIGMSAGTNVACPTIMTTNDMPIVSIASFNATGLFPVQINPHYLDPDPNSTHQGETREQRLVEYLEENKGPVLGLREGSWLVVYDRACKLFGAKPARLFRKDAEPEELPTGSDLGFLLQAT